MDGTRADRAYRESPFRYVYVIGSPGHDVIKIGISDHPEGRARTLRLPTDRTLIPDSVDRASLVVLHQEYGGRRLELALHRHFHTRRVVGEWYHLGPVAVGLIKSAIRDIRAAGRVPAAPTSEPSATPKRRRGERPRLWCTCVYMKDSCRICDPGWRPQEVAR